MQKSTHKRFGTWGLSVLAVSGAMSGTIALIFRNSGDIPDGVSSIFYIAIFVLSASCHFLLFFYIAPLMLMLADVYLMTAEQRELSRYLDILRLKDNK